MDNLSIVLLIFFVVKHFQVYLHSCGFLYPRVFSIYCIEHCLLSRLPCFVLLRVVCVCSAGGTFVIRLCESCYTNCWNSQSKAVQILTHNTLWIQKHSCVCIGHSSKHELWLGVAKFPPPPTPRITKWTKYCAMRAGECGGRWLATPAQSLWVDE